MDLGEALTKVSEDFIKACIASDKSKIRQRDFVCPEDGTMLVEIGYKKKSEIIDVSYKVCSEDFNLYLIEYTFRYREEWNAKTNPLGSVWISEDLDSNLIKEPSIENKEKFNLPNLIKLINNKEFEKYHSKQIVNFLRKSGVEERLINDFIMKYFVR